MLINDEDFSDVNNDGYPDHEPIYQPEDQTPYEQEYEYFTQKEHTTTSWTRHCEN